MSRWDVGSLPKDFTPEQIERAKRFYVQSGRYYANLVTMYAEMERYARRTDFGFWEILDISPRPDREQVKEAYRKLIKENHPDHGGSTTRTQELNRAYKEALAAIKQREGKDPMFKVGMRI